MKPSRFAHCLAALFGFIACSEVLLVRHAAAGETTVVSGSVVDSQGHPIVDARVSLVFTNSLGAMETTCARTGVSGRFELAAELQSHGRDPRFDVLAEAPGFGATPARVPKEGTLQVVMRAATDAEIIFVDERGVAVPGIRVRPEMLLERVNPDPASSQGSSLSFTFPSTIADRFARVSDARGACHFADLPQNTRLRVEIVDEHWARPGFDDGFLLREGAASTHRTITLIPAATITGTVRTEKTGQPAAGIRVGAQSAGPPHNGGEAVSDAAGRYTLRQMRPGVYNVALDLRGELAEVCTARAHERVTLSAGEHLSGIDFDLIPGAVICGHLVAEDNGDPLAGVWIGVYGPAHPQTSAWVQTDKSKADGSYSLRVPPGKQTVYISLPPHGFTKPDPARHDISLNDGETKTLDFKFPRDPR